MRDHLLLMVLYAIAVGVYFGTMWRDSPRERWHHGLTITGSLIGGGVVAAWLMSLAY